MDSPVSPSDFSQLLQSSVGRKVVAAVLCAALGYLVELRVQVGTMSYRLERIERSIDDLSDEVARGRSLHASVAPQ